MEFVHTVSTVMVVALSGDWWWLPALVVCPVGPLRLHMLGHVRLQSWTDGIGLDQESDLTTRKPRNA
jgi:hypothetical protein